MKVYQETLHSLAEVDPERPRKSVIQTLMMKSISQRCIPHQQAVFENTGGRSWFSSFSFHRAGMSLVRGIQRGPENSDRTLTDTVVDKYVRAIKVLRGEVEQDNGINVKLEVQKRQRDVGDGEPMVSVEDISLYEFTSTGPNQDAPIGTYVPLATGQSHILRPKWPLRPSFCLQQLRLHKPSFVWDGALYEHQEDGPGDEIVEEFNQFLADDRCVSRRIRSTLSTEKDSGVFPHSFPLLPLVPSLHSLPRPGVLH